MACGPWCRLSLNTYPSTQWARSSPISPACYIMWQVENMWVVMTYRCDSTMSYLSTDCLCVIITAHRSHYGLPRSHKLSRNHVVFHWFCLHIVYGITLDQIVYECMQMSVAYWYYDYNDCTMDIITRYIEKKQSKKVKLILVWHDKVKSLSTDPVVMRSSPAATHISYALLINQPK